MAVLSHSFPRLEIGLCPRESITGCPFRSSAVRLLRVQAQAGSHPYRCHFCLSSPVQEACARGGETAHTHIHSCISPRSSPSPAGSLQSLRTPTSSTRPDPTRLEVAETHPQQRPRSGTEVPHPPGAATAALRAACGPFRNSIGARRDATATGSGARVGTADYPFLLLGAEG